MTILPRLSILRAQNKSPLMCLPCRALSDEKITSFIRRRTRAVDRLFSRADRINCSGDELYGYMTLSKDWKDGVLSIIMRGMSKNFSDQVRPAFVWFTLSLSAVHMKFFQHHLLSMCSIDGFKDIVHLYLLNRTRTRWFQCPLSLLYSARQHY